MTTDQRMTALALSFPALEDVPGVSPWNATLFVNSIGHLSSGGLHAARFVLSVWNCNHEWTDRDGWNPGPFSLVRALNCWDGDHRAAFQAWAADPWSA